MIHCECAVVGFVTLMDARCWQAAFLRRHEQVVPCIFGRRQTAVGPATYLSHRAF